MADETTRSLGTERSRVLRARASQGGAMRLVLVPIPSSEGEGQLAMHPLCPLGMKGQPLKTRGFHTAGT